MITPYKSRCGFVIQPANTHYLEAMLKEPTLNTDNSNQLFTPDGNVIGMLDNSTLITMTTELIWRDYRPSYKQLLVGYCKTVKYNLIYAKKTLNPYTSNIEFASVDKFYKLASSSDRWPWALLNKIHYPLPETILYISSNVLKPKP